MDGFFVFMGALFLGLILLSLLIGLFEGCKRVVETYFRVKRIEEMLSDDDIDEEMED